MTIADENLKRDMAGIAEQLKSGMVKCGSCGVPVRRDKSVIVVYCQTDQKTILAHKTCANAIGLDSRIEIYSH